VLIDCVCRSESPYWARPLLYVPTSSPLRRARNLSWLHTLLQVLRHGVEQAALLSEQLQRNHMASGSTVQADIVTDMFKGPRVTATPSRPADRNTAARTAQLLGHSKNTHTAGHLADVSQLLAQRRRLERDAAELRTELAAHQEHASKRSSLDRLDAVTQDLVQSLEQRQARARELARVGSLVLESGRGADGADAAGSASPDARGVGGKGRIVRSGLLVPEEQAQRHSTLPQFRLAAGLQRLPAADVESLLDALKVRMHVHAPAQRWSYMRFGQCQPACMCVRLRHAQCINPLQLNFSSSSRGLHDLCLRRHAWDIDVHCMLPKASASMSSVVGRAG
jgi:hypothetical protein